MGPNQSHNNFDELFASSANEQQFDFDPQAWDELETRLDNRDKKRRFLWIFLSGLFIAAIGYFIIPTSSDKTQQQSQSDYHSEQVSTQEAAVLSDETANSTAEAVLDNSATDADQITAALQQKKESKPQLSAETKTRAYNTRINSKPQTNNSEQLYSSTTTTATPPANEPQENHVIAGPTLNSEIQKERHHSSTKEQSVNVVDVLGKMPILAIVPLTTLPQAIDAVVELPVQEQAASTTSLIDRFSISAYGAPEWSFIEGTNKSTMGWRVGLDINYALSDRWYVHSGIGLTKKHVEGNGQAFTKKGGWVMDIAPETMEAKCHMIDVPLLVSHRFAKTKKHAFFAQAGLINYFISSEWYGFDYSPEDELALQNIGQKPLDEINMPKSSNHHWVGVGQISLGYSHKINEHFSIQLSPYFQIPLKGIGEGNTKIYSAGFKTALTFK